MSAGSELDGIFDSLTQCFDVESARRVIAWELDAPVQKRIDLLAERANEGALTPAETAEYEALVNAADFISVLKLKIKRQLQTQIQ